jgi:hypothetical protein
VLPSPKNVTHITINHGSLKVYIIKTLLWLNKNSVPQFGMVRLILRMFTDIFFVIFIPRVDNNVYQ